MGTALYFISAAVRLHRISFPECVVFDEMHFGGFINSYQSHDFFLDIHPPFGKFIYLLCAHLSQYNGTSDFSGGPYQSDFYIQFRMTNALLSAFCIPLFFFILRNSSFSMQSSLCAALCFLSEISFLPQHRFILLDGILHFCVLSHLLLLSVPFVHPICLGLSLGASCGTKLTALSLVPFTALILTARGALHLIVSLVTALVFFFLLSLIHLLLLDRPTMEARSLLSPRLYGQLFVNRSFVRAAEASIGINFVMHRINMKNRQFHPFQSDPLSWPLLTGIWVGLWQSFDKTVEINCMGNLFCFISVLISLFVLSPLQQTPVGLALIGWLFSYLPFFLVSRTKFLYHYQVPLLFGFLRLGAVFERFPKCRALVTCACLFGFWYWSPFAYGTRMEHRASRLWNPVWSTGGARHRSLVHAFFGVWID
jgi:dolichyl-phosphate-mannose--protein O-mannosyl transferase